MTLLEKADVESALRQLVDRLADRGIAADIRVVGGAALCLSVYDRPATGREHLRTR